MMPFLGKIIQIGPCGLLLQNLAQILLSGILSDHVKKLVFDIAVTVKIRALIECIIQTYITDGFVLHA